MSFVETCPCVLETEEVAHLSQRVRVSVWVSYGQSGRPELRYNILRTISVYLQRHCDVIGQQSNRNR